MSEDLKQNIKKWVELDNKAKQLSDQLKVIRNNKNLLNGQIISYVTEKNMNNAIININDGQLKFQTFNTAQPLTFKFIENCLNEIIDDEENVKNIITYIKQKRDIKSIMDIKRYYN